MLLVNSSPVFCPPYCFKIQLPSPIREEQADSRKERLYTWSQYGFNFTASTHIWHIGDLYNTVHFKAKTLISFSLQMASVLLMGHLVSVFHKPWELFWMYTVALRLLWNRDEAFTGDIQETGLAHLLFLSDGPSTPPAPPQWYVPYPRSVFFHGPPSQTCQHSWQINAGHPRHVEQGVGREELYLFLMCPGDLDIHAFLSLFSIPWVDA